MSIFGELMDAGIDVQGPGQEITFYNPVRFDAGTIENRGTGKAFFVDSGAGADTNVGNSWAQALATIDKAVGKCVADRGDIIYLAQGHAENIASATSLICDIAGVSIVGLGSGTLRPKLSFTAAAGSIVVSSANVTLKNIVFEAAFADVAEAFTPSAVELHIIDCLFQDSAAAKNFIELVDTGTTNNQCDGLTFLNCSWISPDLLITSLVNVDADLDRLTVVGCYLNLGVNTSDLPIIAVVATGKDLTNVYIVGNIFIRLNDANPLLISMDTTTANTGVIAKNFIRHLDTGSELLITAASNIGHFENYTTAVVDLSGVIMPAADA